MKGRPGDCVHLTRSSTNRLVSRSRGDGKCRRRRDGRQRTAARPAGGGRAKVFAHLRGRGHLRAARHRRPGADHPGGARCGRGPATVLPHGSSMAATVWAPLLPHLPGRSPCLIDLPGSGLGEPFDHAGVDNAAPSPKISELGLKVGGGARVGLSLGWLGPLGPFGGACWARGGPVGAWSGRGGGVVRAAWGVPGRAGARRDGDPGAAAGSGAGWGSVGLGAVR